MGGDLFPRVGHGTSSGSLGPGLTIKLWLWESTSLSGIGHSTRSKGPESLIGCNNIGMPESNSDDGRRKLFLFPM
jgi:hypothetical protein